MIQQNTKDIIMLSLDVKVVQVDFIQHNIKVL